MDCISTQQAAEKWRISERRVQKYCEDRRIKGAFKFSRVWVIPQNAPKPTDPRRSKAN